MSAVDDSQSKLGAWACRVCDYRCESVNQPECYGPHEHRHDRQWMHYVGRQPTMRKVDETYICLDCQKIPCSCSEPTLPVAVDPTAYVKVKAQRDRLAAELRQVRRNVYIDGSSAANEIDALLREAEGG